MTSVRQVSLLILANSVVDRIVLQFINITTTLQHVSTFSFSFEMFCVHLTMYCWRVVAGGWRSIDVATEVVHEHRLAGRKVQTLVCHGNIAVESHLTAVGVIKCPSFRNVSHIRKSHIRKLDVHEKLCYY